MAIDDEDIELDDSADVDSDGLEPTIDDAPPPEVDRALFDRWREPREGAANPEAMDNPVWAWLIRAGINAWRANQHFGRSSFGSTPTWCFDRFGQSETALSDGRVLLIAGEHEDHYDPDFYIYNDVVVCHPDGRLQIFGYPRADFPPTDFHSATRVGERVVIIGNVGYQDQRRPGETPVYLLDLATFAIRRLATHGDPPGWIGRHSARAEGQRVIVSGGQVLVDDTFVENIDDWCLDLDEGRWTRLTDRRWPRFVFAREDGRRHHLFEYQQFIWNREHMPESHDPETLPAELGMAPDFDAFAAIYRPPVDFAVVEREWDADDWNVTRLAVDGVLLRYVDEMGDVRLTVEGQLDDALLDTITADFVAKLTRVEGVPCICRRI